MITHHRFKKGMIQLLCILLVIAYSLPMLPSMSLAADGAGNEWEQVPIVNGSFEDPGTTTNVGINGWRYHPSLTRGGAELSTEKAADGSQSMKYTGLNGMGIETDPIAVTAGATYKLTYKVNLESVEGAPSVWLRWFSDANGATQVSFISNPMPSLTLNTWHEVEVEVTVPSNITHARILFNSSSATKLVGYFDDVKLYQQVDKSQPPVEPHWEKVQVTNSDFEMPVPGTGNLGVTGWVYWNSGLQKGAAISQDKAYDGQQSIYFSGVKNMGVQTVSFPVVSGDQYKASIQGHVTDIEGDLRVWLRWYNGSKHLYDTYLTVKNDQVKRNEWQEHVIEGIAPAEATHGSVFIYASSNTALVGYFDSLHVYQFISDKKDDNIFEIPLNVVNGGFEESETSMSGWTFWASGNKTGVEVSQEKAFEGKQSLKLTDITATGIQSTFVPVKAGHEYKVSAQIYPTSLTGERGPGVWIRWYTNENTLISADSVAYFNDLKLNEWSLMELRGRAPAGAAYGMIFLYATSDSTINGYIDDVRMFHVVNPDELILPYNYGPPIDLGEATLASRTSSATYANGEIYFATEGNPSTFYAISAATGKTISSHRLPGLNVVWGITVGSDNNVYFGGTTNGNLYKYDSVARTVTTIGKNPAGEFIWDLEASDDSKIYGGTYPTGEMFEYNIQTNEFKNLGVLKEGQLYVRGVGISGDYVYGGTGSFAYLYKINRHDGTKTEIEMPITGNSSMFSNIWKYNDVLFVAYGTSLFAINEETGDVLNHMFWEDDVTFDGVISQPSPLNPELIYFRNNKTSELYTYNTDTHIISAVEPIIMLPQVRMKEMSWTTLPSGDKAGKPVLVMVTETGEYSIYDPAEHSLTNYTTDVASQGVYVNSLEIGPDGKVYLGGYMGSFGIFDPETGTYYAQEKVMNQSEGIGFYNGNVYFGTYGSAVIYRYDPSKPIHFGQTKEHNPGLAFDIDDEQDRPFVLKSGGGKLFIGTFPSYGKLGGAITVHDETDQSWETYRHVVENQSIFGLAYHDGLLYGGTSIYGGLGIDPSEEEAKLFIWNPESNETIKQFVPKIPGIEKPILIGDMVFDKDGLLWSGIAGINEKDQKVMGIFAYNPKTDTVEKSKILIENQEFGSNVRPYYLRWENDLLYTTIGRKLIVVDPGTLNHRQLLDQTVNLMSIAQDGSIYYVYGSKIFKLPVALDTVQLTGSSTSKIGSEIEVNLAGTLINGKPAYIQSGTITYHSSNEEIVKIEDGKIIAVGKGAASGSETCNSPSD